VIVFVGGPLLRVSYPVETATWLLHWQVVQVCAPSVILVDLCALAPPVAPLAGCSLFPLFPPLDCWSHPALIARTLSLPSHLPGAKLFPCLRPIPPSNVPACCARAARAQVQHPPLRCHSLLGARSIGSVVMGHGWLSHSSESGRDGGWGRKVREREKERERECVCVCLCACVCVSDQSELYSLANLTSTFYQI